MHKVQISDYFKKILYIKKHTILIYTAQELLLYNRYTEEHAQKFPGEVT